MKSPLSCRDDLEWLIDLPYTISVPHFDALIVHAGVVPGVALNDQSSIDMYLIRKLVNDSGKGGNDYEPLLQP